METNVWTLNIKDMQIKTIYFPYFSTYAQEGVWSLIKNMHLSGTKIAYLHQVLV
jgi:hypothetical protein